ncbi:MAG: hypothetical protein L7F77_13900 [Candidatus Magnetominusculus sp. LBB02]|nr:hypothetical protein [Candidatus Magnetominusculus sp. LBB02]
MLEFTTKVTPDEIDKMGIATYINEISGLLHLSNLSLTQAIAVLLVFACALNLPFGYLRARQKFRSPMWFLYIHLPIPFVILMRSLVHLDYRFIPLSLVASVIGQYTGGKL